MVTFVRGKLQGDYELKGLEKKPYVKYFTVFYSCIALLLSSLALANLLDASAFAGSMMTLSSLHCLLVYILTSLSKRRADPVEQRYNFFRNLLNPPDTIGDRVNAATAITHTFFVKLGEEIPFLPQDLNHIPPHFYVSHGDPRIATLVHTLINWIILSLVLAEVLSPPLAAVGLLLILPTAFIDQMGDHLKIVQQRLLELI